MGYRPGVRVQAGGMRPVEVNVYLRPKDSAFCKLRQPAVDDDERAGGGSGDHALIDGKCRCALAPGRPIEGRLG